MEPQVFLTAKWRHLLMLNFAVPEEVLTPRVPKGTELDLWKGQALVSVVGFMFLDTRVKGVAIPFHQNFEEINLRFYVRRSAPDGDRRGVTFIKELVPRTAIAFVARAIYNENYSALPMRHDVVEQDGLPSKVSYGWRTDGRWNHIAGEATPDWRCPEKGSEEEFITEHYWGYACQRDGGCMEYKVEHPPWRVARVSSPVADADFTQTYGPEFTEALSRRPTSAFIADGSNVKVYAGLRL